jgi:transposase
MSAVRAAELRKEAVRIALTSGLSRKQIAADLGVGLSTLTKWAMHTRTRNQSWPRIASWQERLNDFGVRSASSRI